MTQRCTCGRIATSVIASSKTAFPACARCARKYTGRSEYERHTPQEWETICQRERIEATAEKRNPAAWINAL